jgi:transcription-repair coupling factor (superfamily II helicase)
MILTGLILCTSRDSFRYVVVLLISSPSRTNLPYRVEFFGDLIESIRTFEIESQLSVEQVKSITIVPNVQSKFLTESNISLLEFIDPSTQIWIKDVQFTLDIIQDGFKKATNLWKAFRLKKKHRTPNG